MEKVRGKGYLLSALIRMFFRKAIAASTAQYKRIDSGRIEW
jgi:lipocalin